MGRILTHLFRFIVFLLLQVIVFNNINLFGYYNPYIYLIPLLMLPIHMNKSLVLILGFFTGIFIDAFYGVLGIHAAACVMACACRYPLMRFIHNVKERGLGELPVMSVFGVRQYIVFAFLFVLIHHTVMFFLDVMTLRQFYFTLLLILINTAITTAFIVIYQVLFHSGKK